MAKSKFYAPTKLSENIRETPEGFLVCMNVPIARTGWQEYGANETPIEVGQGGTVQIYRDPDEVFREETIKSFEGKPVTVKHPSDFVTPKNWSYLAKGVLQNVRKGDEDENGNRSLVADILITDDFTINLVKAGLREVSCGYEADYEDLGEGKGRQKNIIGNHLALVEQGRAGSSYAINDEKGIMIMNKTIEKLKAKFGAKVVDEAMAEAGEKKEVGMDEVVKMVADLGEKMSRVEGFLKQGEVKGGGVGFKGAPKAGEAKDDEEEKEKKPMPEKDEGEKENKEEKAKDDEEENSENEAESDILERVKRLEAAVAKLLEKFSEDAYDEEKEKEESKDDEEEEESEDEDYGEESEDGPAVAELPGKGMDEKARIEILAPGMKKTKGINIKSAALKQAYTTKDGKRVIDTLSLGKPNFESNETVDTLFVSASEVLKSMRGTGLESTRDGTVYKDVMERIEKEGVKVPPTADDINKMNEAHWARKSG